MTLLAILNTFTVPFLLALVLIFCAVQLVQYFAGKKKNKKAEKGTLKSFALFIGLLAFWVLGNSALGTLQNLPVYALLSQGSSALCPDYALERGGCVEAPQWGSGNTNGADTWANTTHSVKNSSDGYAPVPVLGSIFGEGKNITTTLIDDGFTINYDTRNGPVSFYATVRDKNNSVTQSFSKNGETTVVDMTVEETDYGVTIHGTKLDKNGKETSVTIEGILNGSNRMSFYNVEKDGTLTQLETIATKMSDDGMSLSVYSVATDGTLTLKSTTPISYDPLSDDAPASSGFLEEAIDAIGGFLGNVASAVADGITAFSDAISSAFGFGDSVNESSDQTVADTEAINDTTESGYDGNPVDSYGDGDSYGYGYGSNDGSDGGNDSGNDSDGIGPQ